jgi:23S rRNA pseudouridine1911/1915/1917 synthase
MIEIDTEQMYTVENIGELNLNNVSQRLDIWLSNQIPDLSRSRVQTLISQGNVKVNDETCTSKKISVKTGDRIHLTLPETQPTSLQPESIPLDILYEDDSLIIINKPAGLVVHPAAGHPDGTLVNALLAHCPLSAIGGVQRPGIVHRLDKDTTGAIAIAKTDIAHQHIQAQLKTKTARREYLGIVYGIPNAEIGTVDLPIGRHPTDRRKMGIVPVEKGGREAITHWTIKERIGNYSLIHYQLETGRTHQIRVHTAEIKHPIIGDPMYSSNRSIGVNLTGQALHAWRLQLEHPLTGELIEAIAPLPDQFNTLLRILRLRAQT